METPNDTELTAEVTISGPEAPMPEKMLEIPDQPNDSFLSFHHSGTKIGELKYSNSKFSFVGDADESAKVFIEALEDKLVIWMEKRLGVKP